ncbi:hypothetical protein KR054_008279, partial [Drosophila jambulina]
VIHFIKLGVLLVVWACFTFVLMSYNDEAKVTKTVVTAMPNEIVLRKVTLKHDHLRITLRGPIDVYCTKHPTETESFGLGVRVEIRSSDLSVTHRHTAMWNIVLDPKGKYDEVTHFFKISPPDAADRQTVVAVESKSEHPVGLMMEMEPRPMSDRVVLYAGLMIVLLYLVIISDVIDRTFVALLISAVGIAALSVLGDRPHVTTILSFVNFETLMLLFGFMAIVDLMVMTGVFEYLVVKVYKLSMGQPWPLIFFLSMLTAFLSAFLSSDNMALVLTPVTIRLCETVGLRTQSVLIIMIIYNNLGGALTPLGNPTNAIVSNHLASQVGGVNFVNFTGRMFPGVIIAMLGAFPLLYLILRKEMFVLDQFQLDVVDQRTRKMMPLSEEFLERIAQREGMPPRKWWIKPGNNYHETLIRLEDKYPILDKPLLVKCCITLAFAYLCMIVHSVSEVVEGATLGWVILLAAFLLIILDNKTHFDRTLAIIQWTILLFIAGLYVLTETVARLGLFKWIADRASKALSKEEWMNQNMVVITVFIWATAGLSILIDNLVVTNFMVSLCFFMTETNEVKIRRMIWAITFGAGFGGNGSLLGAWSNEIIAWIARRAGYKIGFGRFFIVGFPIMIVTLVICSAYMLIDLAILAAI